MERINRGEIWVVEPVGFPKPRPALVISINPINDLCAGRVARSNHLQTRSVKSPNPPTGSDDRAENQELCQMRVRGAGAQVTAEEENWKDIPSESLPRSRMA